MQSRELMAQELRRHGMRATGPRLAVLALLRGDFTHPTPESVHAALRAEHPSLSLSTVYQTLEAFLGAGLCRQVAPRGGRLRVDGTPGEHDHAVCRSCGTVIDLHRGESFQAPAPADLPKGAELIGFHIEYEVVCAACRLSARTT